MGNTAWGIALGVAQYSPGNAGECELQLGTAGPDGGHGRGLLSSLIRNSTQGFL